MCPVFVSCNMPSVLEPVGVCGENVKQPGGILWQSGCPIVWDFMLCDRLVQSLCQEVGSLACHTEKVGL